MRQASVILADDVTFSINGKMNLVGIYTNDIVIPFSPIMLGQLIILFIVEADPVDPFQHITLSVTLPNGQNMFWPIQMETMQHSGSDATRWCLRWPVAFTNAVLTPGIITCKVHHESGELSAIASVIRINQPAPIPAQN